MQKAQEFYIITPPGFERTAKNELLQKAQLLQLDPLVISVESGGLKLSCTLEQINHLQYYLKIPTRILMRIESFKARDFPKLFAKVKKIRWSKYFYQDAIKIAVTTKKSRLIHSEKIAQCIQDALEDSFSHWPAKKGISQWQNLYVRLINDECTLSLDLSGDALYKRSLRQLKSLAPIRENLAAAIFYEATSIGNYEQIVSPMCGSGTFLYEAKSFYAPMQREFASNLLPLKIKAHKKSMINELTLPLVGVDLKKIDLSSEMRFIKEDFFQLKENFSNSLMLVNPPYGKRIKLSLSPSQYYSNLVDKCFEKGASILSIIIPRDVSLKHEYVKKIDFKNGGFNVSVYFLKK